MTEPRRPTRAGSRRMSIAVTPSHAAALQLPMPQPPVNGERRKTNVATTALVATAAVAVLRRSLSGFRSTRDLRFEVHVASHGRPRHRLLVSRSMTLIALQAMVQRELGVSYQDQRLFLFGDELEGDDELAVYGVSAGCEFTLKVRKRHRSISDVFRHVKTIQFKPSAGPDDYSVVEVVAPLPPLPVVLRRIFLIVSYLTTLDRMQAKRTNHRVWCADPFARDKEIAHQDDESAVREGNNSPRLPGPPRPIKSSFHPSTRSPLKASTSPPPHTLNQQAAETPQSFVLQQAHADQRLIVHGGPSLLAAQLNVPLHLKVPPDARAPSAIRQIRRWLATLKYFLDAKVPDSVLYETARAATYVAFEPGEFIFRQGDPGDFFYILITGCVSLAAYGNGHFATMTPGSCFGEISLLEARSLRSASANVSFATPLAELALVPGDVYRRFINPFKQAVLQSNEHSLFSVPQLRGLPPTALTHLAYGMKMLTVRPGKRLIRRGDVVKVLVLLIKGTVKVSSSPNCGAGFPPTLTRRRSRMDHSSYRVVSVVNGPAVFGQEGALSNSPTPAPWDVEAIDLCSLVCIQADVVSIFLQPCHETVRALLAEHRIRIQQFAQRFAAYQPLTSPSRPSFRKKSSLHFIKAVPETPSPMTPDGRRSIVFPKILLKEEDEPGDPIVPKTTDSTKSGQRRGAIPTSVEQRRPFTSPDSFLLSSRCAARQDDFLHRSLPFSPILTLREQIRFASIAQQTEKPGEEQAAERVSALLDGLRRLEPEEVQLVATSPCSKHFESHYYFAASPTTQ